MGSGPVHQLAAGDVCSIELVDGAQASIAGATGISAAAARAKALNQAQPGQESMKLVANSALFSPCKHSRINVSRSGGYAEHPQASKIIKIDNFVAY